MSESTSSLSSKSLSAIMFTDIEGYTSIMGKDETRAMELVRKNRSIQKPLIEKYGGTWLKEMGDGTMSSFPAASDAIYCAKEIQKALHDADSHYLRIGIHVGEVINEDGDIYGDGVNIASRIEAFAPPGGICISEVVNRSIRGKGDLETVFYKEVHLKNVEDPVKIYAVKDKYLTLPSPDRKGKKLFPKPLLIPGLLIVLIALIWTLVLNDDNRELADGSEESTLVVFPFRVQGNENLIYLEEGMVDLVSSKLNGLFDFRTVDPHMVVSSITSDDVAEMTPEELFDKARELGAGRYILGSIIQLGESYRIKITVYTEDLNQANEAEVVIKGENDLIPGIDELIRKAVSGQLLREGLQTEGLTVYATDSYDAVRAYLEGEILRRKGNYNGALSMYAEAIGVDSTMSIAWLRLWQACSWTFGTCEYEQAYVLKMAAEYQDDLPDRLRNYVDAAIARYTNDLTAEQKYRDLIGRYGESVDYLIGLGEELYHNNEMKGRMPSEATQYFLKAWEYDRENVEVTNHLIQLLAYERDTVTLQRIVDELGYDSDYGYRFKAVEILSSQRDWTEDDLNLILDHPKFNFRLLFDYCLIDKYLNRFRVMIGDLEQLRGEPFYSPPDFPFNVIIRLWGGQEAEAAKLLASNPYTNYLLPLCNLEEPLDYLEEYLDEFPPLSPDRQGPSPYSFAKAIQMLTQRDDDGFREYYDQLNNDETIGALTRSYLAGFLDGIKLRQEGNYQQSNELLEKQLRSTEQQLAIVTDAFIRGAMKMAIAENYYDLGNYEQAVHWYNVRFNLFNGGDEIVVGYSLYRRGQIYEQMEEYTKAVEYYDRFLDLYRNSDPKYKDWMNQAEQNRQRILTMNI